MTTIEAGVATPYRANPLPLPLRRHAAVTKHTSAIANHQAAVAAMQGASVAYALPPPQDTPPRGRIRSRSGDDERSYTRAASINVTIAHFVVTTEATLDDLVWLLSQTLANIVVVSYDAYLENTQVPPSSWRKQCKDSTGKKGCGMRC